MKNTSRHIVSLYIQIFLYQIIGLLFFTIARFIHLNIHSSLSPLFVDHADDVPLFLWNSWRFDIQAITYISIPTIVGTLIVSYMKLGIIERFKRFMRWYYSIMLTILAFIIIAEFFFYNNFNSRYNIVFFDFLDEGPKELLQTMWQDYPFLEILVAGLIIGIAIGILGKRISGFTISHNFIHTGIWGTIAISVVIAGLTFVFMRGSVTRYTLQVEAFMVSTDNRINQAVPNALYLLKNAYKEKKNSFKLYSDMHLLKQEGFASIDEAIAAAGFPSIQTGTNEEKIKETLFRHSHEDSHTQEKELPNVLIILNESWSQFLLEMDKGEKLDLLGSLRRHINEDLLFNNIQSVRNGTIYSLEAITLAMPYPKFFHSRFRFIGCPTSIAYPFKENGYNTAFITGLDPTWENVQEGLSYQSFDTIIGRQNILQDIQGSTTSAIGVYDEFLYQYIHTFLKRNEKVDKPQFILTLTTTNHPPFTYPEDMKLPPLNDEWYNSSFLTGNKEILHKYGLGVQYANQALGNFLEHFKQSPFANNTIVLATGDHNVRSILDYKKVEHKYMHAVPLYLYLPPQYKISKEQEEYISKRYGSHWDILPTLAPMCFNNGTSYLCIGQNLLDTTKCNDSYYSYNEKQLLTQYVNKQDSLMKMMKARELLMKVYYQQMFKNKN